MLGRINIEGENDALTLIARNISKEHFVNEAQASHNSKNNQALEKLSSHIFNMLKVNQENPILLNDSLEGKQKHVTNTGACQGGSRFPCLRTQEP